jgi:hypothetical protein
MMVIIIKIGESKAETEGQRRQRQRGKNTEDHRRTDATAGVRSLSCQAPALRGLIWRICREGSSSASPAALGAEKEESRVRWHQGSPGSLVGHPKG